MPLFSSLHLFFHTFYLCIPLAQPLSNILVQSKRFMIEKIFPDGVKNCHRYWDIIIWKLPGYSDTDSERD